MQIQLYPVLVNFSESEDTGIPPNKPKNRASQENPPVEPEIKLAQIQSIPSLYFSSPTTRRTQPDQNYSESDLENAGINYMKASKLIQEFDNALRDLPPLSRDLKGYTVILDPGHGGLDPGAIVANSDGNGNTVYVVEDEYCYDLSLRVYRDLVRHGAEVVMTIISPNQTIRTTKDASITFVNEKNEVYNSTRINTGDDNTVWPVGNAWGLDERKVVAADALKGKKNSRTMFVSIHSDNNPGDGKGTRILYHPDEENKPSEALARHLRDYLGNDSDIRAQDVRVLRENPAGAAVLIEVRNLAYKDNAWAIRNEELRQDDADRIVRGIVDYFK
jgi:N-acetylmuramoyl-L-alanine amidase